MTLLPHNMTMVHDKSRHAPATCGVTTYLFACAGHEISKYVDVGYICGCMLGAVSEYALGTSAISPVSQHLTLLNHEMLLLPIVMASIKVMLLEIW